MKLDSTIERLSNAIDLLTEDRKKAHHELILLRENLIGHRELVREQRQNAGRRGMEARWGKRT